MIHDAGACAQSRSAKATKATLHLTLCSEGSKEGAIAKIFHAILWPSMALSSLVVRICVRKLS